jgi:hypothetical protein
MSLAEEDAEPRPAGPGSSFEARFENLLARLRWQVAYYVIHFVEGDHQWGEMRWTAILAVVLVFVVISRLFEPIASLPLFDFVIDYFGLRGLIPAPALNLAAVVLSFFTRQVLRHAIPVVLGVLVAIYYGAAYIRELLELPNLQQALKFLTATLFGRDYPRMEINEGKAGVADPATNPMLKIGGPGWVDIKIGNAALFERVVGPSSVLGAGSHFLRRFETLREVFDLREIERVRDDVKMMTKDGVPIVLHDMRARFRVRARELRTEANPYPVMTGAIRKAAYSRKVTAKGLEVWSDMVAGAVRGTISDWIAHRRMDELIAPPRDGNEPEAPAPPPYRQALHELFKHKNTRQKFAEMGAEIIWVSVGHLRPDPDVDPGLDPDEDATGHDKIHAQLIDTWKAGHAAQAADEITDARAYGRWLNDTARAEAEVKLIQALTTGLRQAGANGLPLDDLLTERLLEVVSGVKVREAQPGQGQGQQQNLLLALNSLLQSSELPPPRRDLLTRK